MFGLVSSDGRRETSRESIMNYAHEDIRANLTYNDKTKKLTVTHKQARCSKQTFYGPISLEDVRDLTVLLKAKPDAKLADILTEWENI